jgi:hypothetical protein
MRFDTKIAIAVRADLAAWQKLNVTAFLASAVAAGVPGITGAEYLDGSGHTYLPMYRQPVLIYAADGPGLGLARAQALERGLPAAIYIDEMFKTGNDQDNRAAVKAARADEMNLAGLAIYGPKNTVDKILKGLPLHP